MRHHRPAGARRCRGGYRCRPWRRAKEILQIAGREVTITNPRKVYFPEAGHTKLRPRPLLPGGRRRRAARRRAAGRWRSSGSWTAPPGEPFFQKRAPDNRPDWIRTAELTFPSGPDRRRDRPRRRRPVSPGSSTSAASTSTRTRSAPTTSTIPTSCAWTWTRSRACAWSQIRDVALVARRRSRRSGSSAGPRPPARAGSTSTSGSSRAGRTRRSAARRWRWPATWSGGRRTLATSQVVEGGAPRRLPRLQPERQGPDGRVRLLVRPLPDARVSTPLTWDEVPDRRGRGVHDRDRPGALRGDRRSRAPASTTRSARSRRCSSSAGAHEAEGQGDAPWPPNYAQAGRRAAARPAVEGAPAEGRVRAGPRRGGGPPPEVAAERAAAVAAGDPNAGLPTEWDGSRPTPTGRRKTSIPVIEISRAAYEGRGARGPGALEGAPSGVVAFLEPADVLVDGMRGRSSLWYRVRVNLIHVPEADRPAQEPLDSDYDPWAGHGHRGLAGRRRTGSRDRRRDASRSRSRRTRQPTNRRPT